MFGSMINDLNFAASKNPKFRPYTFKAEYIAQVDDVNDTFWNAKVPYNNVVGGSKILLSIKLAGTCQTGTVTVTLKLIPSPMLGTREKVQESDVQILATAPVSPTFTFKDEENIANPEPNIEIRVEPLLATQEPVRIA
jgi:hypothetical protein